MIRVLALTSLLLATPAQAACVSVRIATLDAYQADRAASATRFRFNEKLVICVLSRMNGFVSLWDAPPAGDFERLLPAGNSPHVAQGAAPVVAGEEVCVGTPETYPLYIPEEEGRGGGKVSAVVTATLDDQPQEEDYLIPGRSIGARTMRGLSVRPPAGENCEPKMTIYLDYRVE